MLAHSNHVVRTGFAYLSTGRTGGNTLFLFLRQRAIIVMHGSLQIELHNEALA
jgi:hypothetical protein